jgi:peptidoglycan/LPS O-acetylase OafA/YrhL
MQFTAGALVCAAVRKLRPSEGTRRAAGYASLVLGATIVAILYRLDANPLPKIADSAGLVDVLFVPLLFTLAIGTGTLPGLLSLRPIVYLGHVSFSLYMVHELVHTTWNWMVTQFELRLSPDITGKLIMVALLGAALIGAVMLYHFVEEPARKWMRSMMSAPTDSRPNMPGRLHTVYRPRERTEVVSARAG